MLPNWLYGKSKSKLASILGVPSDYAQVKAQVTQNEEDIEELSDFVNISTNLNDPTQISVADTSILEIASCNITKKGNVLCGQIIITCKADLPLNTLLFTLPEKFRPKAFSQLVGAKNTASSSEITMFGLWPSGSVQLQTGIALATNNIRIQVFGCI